MGKYNLLGGMLCHHGGDDTGDEDHHDDTIQHIAIDKIDAWCHLQAHAYHHHGDGTGCVGRGHTEHHITIALWPAEKQTGEISGYSLSEGTEKGDKTDDPQNLKGCEDGAYINQHTNTDEEIGNEDRVTDKLYAVHQG